MKCTRCLGMVVAVVSVLGGAVADEPAEETEFVLLNRYREAIRAERWTESSLIYEQLRGHPAHASLLARTFYAQANYELGKLDSAEALLNRVLEQEEHYVKALYLLAKVHAKQAETSPNPLRKRQFEQSAKDVLIVAAGAGQYVYRDMREPSAPKLFAQLADDSAFVLEVFKATRGRRIVTEGIHNPFRTALRKTPPQETQEEPPATDEELEAKLEAIYLELVELAADEQWTELEAKLELLAALLSRAGPGASETSRAIRERYAARFAEFDVVLRSVKLQEWVNEGNGELRAMVHAIDANRYDVALSAFTRLEAIAVDMRREDEPTFARHAELLSLRGKQLAERAQRQKEIAEFELVITGIVVATSAASQGEINAYDSAIVNDRILRLGDAVFASAKALDANPNLHLVEISPSGTTLTFEYFGTTFVRGLKSRGGANGAIAERRTPSSPAGSSQRR